MNWEICCPETPLTTEEYRETAKGWGPKTEEDRKAWGRIITARMLEEGDLNNVGRIIREEAMAINYSTTASRRKEKIKTEKGKNGIAEL